MSEELIAAMRQAVAYDKEIRLPHGVSGVVTDSFDGENTITTVNGDVPTVTLWGGDVSNGDQACAVSCNPYGGDDLLIPGWPWKTS